MLHDNPQDQHGDEPVSNPSHKMETNMVQDCGCPSEDRESEARVNGSQLETATPNSGDAGSGVLGTTGTPDSKPRRRGQRGHSTGMPCNRHSVRAGLPTGPSAEPNGSSNDSTGDATGNGLVTIGRCRATMQMWSKEASAKEGREVDEMALAEDLALLAADLWFAGRLEDARVKESEDVIHE